MTINELAWAAGLFDGEGCFTSHRQGRYPVVRMTQVDREVLDKFKSAIGLGYVAGPYKGKRKSHYQFYAYGFDKTQAIGAMLWKHLSSVKRNQFRKIMEYSDCPGTNGNRKGIKNKNPYPVRRPFMQRVESTQEQAARLLNIKEF